MYRRTEEGATLGFSAITTAVVIAFGLSMFYLVRLLGGSVELQNAVDAGNLSVAKNAVSKPEVGLLPGGQTDNFYGLVNNDGKIDLLDYNRVVGQTLLVALNAQAEKTPRAQAHAQQVLQLAQLNKDSVGARLLAALQDPANTSNYFNSTGFADSLRMLTNSGTLKRDDSRFQVAFAEAGGPSNVWLDATILPDQSVKVPTTSDKSATSGFAYVSGYTPVANAAPSLSAITLPPTQSHLISKTEFAKSSVSPQIGRVPANSFLNVAAAPVDKNHGSLTAISTAIAGSLGRDFPVSIPRGYVQITNEDPMPSITVDLPTGATLYNNELATGIYVDKTSDVFTTDLSQYNAWLKYNQAPAGPTPNNSEIKNGSATAIKDASPQLCTWLNAFTCPTCTKNLLNFHSAYPYKDQGQLITFSGVHRLTAAEYYKVKFLEKVQNTLKDGSSKPSESMLYDMPSELIEKQTGMKLYYPIGKKNTDYTEHYTAPPGYAKYNYDFGTIGTPDELLKQVTYPHPGGVRPGNQSGDEEYNRLLGALIQRVREIKPTATYDDVKKLFLSAPPLPPGQSVYIYMPDGKNLQIMPAPPPWAVPGDGQYPDGLTDGLPPPLEYTQRFPIIKNVVDAQGSNPSGYKGQNGKDGDAGFHQVPYKHGPSNNLGSFDKQGKEIPNGPLRCGIHSSSWMPSSGFDNFLGKLNFTEKVESQNVTFSTPN